jgi:hypothetical protein
MWGLLTCSTWASPGLDLTKDAVEPLGDPALLRHQGTEAPSGLPKAVIPEVPGSGTNWEGLGLQVPRAS